MKRIYVSRELETNLKKDPFRRFIGLEIYDYSEFEFYLLTEKVRNGSRHEELGSLSVSFV